MKNLLPAIGRSAATIVIVLLAAFIAYWMWMHYERSPWTRDGRVRADVVRVTPDIGGLVTSVSVHDNQQVKAGDLLFVIDKPRYSLAVEQAEASLSSARATLGQAQRESSRDLALGDLVATESHEQNVAKVATARAAVAEAQSALDGARLNLQRTQVHASVNGTVTNLDLHPGDYVAAGSQAMALVDGDSIRVEGYFEETKLPLIRIGAPVSVKLMGEENVLKGRVESIAAGINDDTRSDSGNLLPNVAATFSWVRLAQRIPVRVRLTQVPKDVRLILGRTATVTIEQHGEQHGEQHSQNKPAPKGKVQ
ncbi:efflux RND transporter periplasmic adaptor subunit [Novosphingobium resinovorum]|uniref:Efflux transporter periplasmic adaptor subunit n=1 Tax=Novosphingobium resinovorum TaxID=158500 RepID=A0A1D8A0C7_9SPHN|nr:MULTISPECIES: efflux RND transporter periplasmic adaptor subunit [Sphingomonadaceae]AOR75559.1 efflux transporter periplasmic adaptor subunit [Novosphingobium resinovorum]EJU09960.1 secretion protein HlyD family protein [Sphingomonas sp. LH128]MBF7010881.1 efflux RND transporter periplasmic adaptor subunit [Novosphingobium sp. HR1a]WJM28878.1 efflux RND transporter periplasmic adaptor subunit [Novosphingobium resinovorum]